MEKNMFFAIPEMPSKTFVMLYKKNFLITLRRNGSNYSLDVSTANIRGSEMNTALLGCEL